MICKHTPTLKLYPSPSEHPAAAPGSVDLALDDGDGPIWVGLSREQARLLGRQLLEASFRHELSAARTEVESRVCDVDEPVEHEGDGWEPEGVGDW